MGPLRARHSCGPHTRVRGGDRESEEEPFLECVERAVETAGGAERGCRRRHAVQCIGCFARRGRARVPCLLPDSLGLELGFMPLFGREERRACVFKIVRTAHGDAIDSGKPIDAIRTIRLGGSVHLIEGRNEACVCGVQGRRAVWRVVLGRPSRRYSIEGLLHPAEGAGDEPHCLLSCEWTAIDSINLHI